MDKSYRLGVFISASLTIMRIALVLYLLLTGGSLHAESSPIDKVKRTLNFAGFSDVEVSGCVVQAGTSAGGKVHRYKFNLNLRYIDFDKIDFELRTRDGVYFYKGTLGFNESFRPIEHSRRVFFRYISEKYSLDWSTDAQRAPNWKVKEIEADMLASGIAKDTFDRFYLIDREITIPFIAAFSFIHQDRSVIEDLFNDLEIVSDFNGCSLMSG